MYALASVGPTLKALRHTWYEEELWRKSIQEIIGGTVSSNSVFLKTMILRVRKHPSAIEIIIVSELPGNLII